MAGNYGITQSKLRFSDERLKQLTDDAGATINTTKVDDAILAAEQEFHLYAGVYYATPVRTSAAAIPEGLEQKLIEAARWFLMQNRPEFLRSDDDEGAQWETRRKEWMKYLERISDARAEQRLPVPGAVERSGQTARGGTASIVSDEQFFTSTTGYM